MVVSGDAMKKTMASPGAGSDDSGVIVNLKVVVKLAT